MKKIFIWSFIIIVISIFAFIKMPVRETPIIIDTPQTKEPLIKDLSWYQYANDKFGFSVSYPCNDNCESARIISKDNGADIIQLNLPTKSSSTFVTIGIISIESIEEWNNAVKDSDNPFTVWYDLDKFSGFLNSDIGTLFFDYPYKDRYKAEVVDLNGKKALLFNNFSPHSVFSPCEYEYFVPLKNKFWLRACLLVDTYGNPERTRLFHKDESLEVIGTLQFSK